jgi:hypothetical protein
MGLSEQLLHNMHNVLGLNTATGVGDLVRLKGGKSVVLIHGMYCSNFSCQNLILLKQILPQTSQKNSETRPWTIEKDAIVPR